MSQDLGKYATVLNAIGQRVPASINTNLRRSSQEWFFPTIVRVFCGAAEVSRWIRPVKLEGGVSIAAWGGGEQQSAEAEQRLMNLGYERIR